MTKTKAPVLYLGVLPKPRKKKSVVLPALMAAEKLLDSVAYVMKEGDTVKPLKLIRAAIKEVNQGK